MKKILTIVLALVVIAGLFYVFSSSKSRTSNLQKQQTVQTVSPTISCSGIQTVAEEEGPYYKKGSPQRSTLFENGMQGTKLVLTGYVLNTHCKPLAHAWLDFWQADSNGHYDNSGFTFRGHQYTDSNGKFMLTTVVPGEYPGRTPHIHVKIQASNTSPILTTQLYLPGLATNARDAIYNPTLQMQQVKSTSAGKSASFIFIVKP